MQEIGNLLILMFFGFCFQINTRLEPLFILSFLCATICSLYATLYPKRTVLSWFYLPLCFFYNQFLFLLPCIFYTRIKDKQWHYTYLFFFLPFLIHTRKHPVVLLASVLLIIAYFLRSSYLQNEEIHLSYRKQRDSTKELALLLEDKNNNLLIRQNQEIHIATLNERNRIAREIHDHVGHLLSSALLQIGAIQATNTSSDLYLSLSNLRETISKGMDNVRNSVHDLHDDAVDLEMAIHTLCKAYSFCETIVHYDILHPIESLISYHLIAILKESLHNTMKHSDATCVSVTLREQPAFYQFIIHDNGSPQTIKRTGMGLDNIKERISGLHGYCNINNDHGFQIFITLMKEA